MENGVQALKIASSMLIFVIAITITISCFSSAAQALNRIFAMQDADDYVTDEDGNFLNFMNFEEGVGTRIVGIETIVPSIYRAYKENYAIYFYNTNGTEFKLYETQKGGQTVEINYIDLEQSSKDIDEILYDEGLYDKLKGKTFVEMLGEYYMEDVRTETSEEDDGELTSSNVNKTKKRVIVYRENQ